MPHINADFEAFYDPAKVYDGELYSHRVIMERSFQFLTGLLKIQDWDLDNYKGKKQLEREAQLPYRNMLEFHAFDWVYKTEWDARKSTMPQLQRLQILEQEVLERKAHGCQSVVYVPHRLVYSLEEAIALNGEHLLQGYEGSMYKDPKATYKFGRGTGWFKYKVFMDEEFTITGTYEGKPDSKWAGTLGGFHMVTKAGQPFDCGAGRMSMPEHHEFWSIRETLPGQQATTRFFEYTPDGIPRFPIFHAIREPGT